ncbi:putative transmembrane protein [Rodentibacter pneumotropicus]|uniref:Putative transmembrane protein n=1 Tax=Rodentibacter pneumotropicus TaxID=758 RepID=A0A448MLA4_9PAST|nr:putative transmembrane protein [Rodentibacter pneumotropicus]
MSKRKTITLTLAAILVIIGAGAQIYTNHKVDQVLQKFPYSLDNQAILKITESNKNFFSRDLVFSVTDNGEQDAEIIFTKLTTLPFFITAESKFSDQLVRKLNKDLNITIDKNTINSKFSPVGDYLQSNILTEFRDFANKPQQMAISLNFLNDRDIELKGNLTGFNYDNESKLNQVEGKVYFTSSTENKYDLTNIELTAENAELALLNGENTRLQLKNTTYKFNKNKENNTEKRDLTTKLSSDIYVFLIKTVPQKKAKQHLGV